MADVYVVLDPAFALVLGVSGRLQGAEIIKSKYAIEQADRQFPSVPNRDVGSWTNAYNMVYARCRIDNHELVYEDD